MSARYALYGLQLASPIPLPFPPGVPGLADVTLHFGVRPPDASAWGEEPIDVLHCSEAEQAGVPVLLADRPPSATGAWLRLRYAEGIRFHVAPDGGAVWSDWRPPLTEADAATFLAGPVLGAVLRRRGALALHASAVVIDGRAWGFLGPRGSGKSTLAAACAAAGIPVLTEDVLALRRRGEAWIAAPGHGDVRLWDEGADLVARATGLAPLTPTWPKRRLALGDGEVHAAAVPLAGCFVVGDYGAPGAPPTLRPLGVAPGLVELVANVYVNYLATAEELARELRVLGALAPALAHWRLAPAHGRDGLAETVRAVTAVTRGAHGT